MRKPVVVIAIALAVAGIVLLAIHMNENTARKQLEQAAKELGDAMLEAYEWCVDTGEEFTEHSVIYGGYLYVPACDYTNKNGGVKKYNMSGELMATYGASYYTQAAPIIYNSGGTDYMIIYDLRNGYVRRVDLSSDSQTHSAALSTGKFLDIESMGWDTASSRVIAPVYITEDSKWYLRSYNMGDLSVAWSYEFSMSGGYEAGSADSPLVVGSYVYWLNLTDGVLYKVALSNGALADSVDLGDGGSWYSYASPVYDDDNARIYAVSYAGSYVNKLSAVDPSDMSVTWTHSFAAGTGSDSDSVTYTGMTTPHSKGTIAYHNGKVIIGVREANADADQYHAKVWGISATAGTKSWAYTGVYDDGQDVGQAFLLTASHVVIAGLDYDYSATNYHVGTLYVLNQSDGTLVFKGALPWGVTCGGVTQAYDGRIFLDMFGGFVGSMRLGWGDSNDSVHWGKNQDHTQHTTNLVIDTSLTLASRSTTITGWTEEAQGGADNISAEGSGLG